MNLITLVAVCDGLGYVWIFYWALVGVFIKSKVCVGCVGLSYM